MDPRSKYGVVSSNIWSEVWIIGGGPSARAFDRTRIGERVIAVNDAIFEFSARLLFPLGAKTPSAVTSISVDGDWVTRHRAFLSATSFEKYVAIPLETWTECTEIPGMIYLQRSHDGGLSEDPRKLETGGNSGYAAINLAYLQGAELIHLVGFDMDPSANESYAEWIPRFRTMLPQLMARRVRVVNHNPHSHIDAFEKGT